MTTEIKQNVVIADIINERIESQKLTIRQFAIKLGIEPKTMYDRLSRDGFKGVYDFLRVAKLLNIDLNELRDKL